MFAAVVLTGNHYVVDGLLGAMVAVIGLVISLRITPKLYFGRATYG
jgi:membrane-associated phospholipid phosphatase